MEPRLVEDGYFVVKDAVDAADVESLRVAIEDLIAERDHNGEVWWPSRLSPSLDRHPALLAARATAGRLLGTRWPRKIFEHAIHREPGDPVATGWHQDAAYSRRHVGARQVHLWMPLHDVDQERGPLKYLPTPAQRTVLTHAEVAGTDRLVLDVDESKAVVCPAHAGDIVAHVPSTPHAALPNLSRESRQVLVMQFRKII